MKVPAAKLRKQPVAAPARRGAAPAAGDQPRVSASHPSGKLVSSKAAGSPKVPMRKKGKAPIVPRTTLKVKAAAPATSAKRPGGKLAAALGGILAVPLSLISRIPLPKLNLKVAGIVAGAVAALAVAVLVVVNSPIFAAKEVVIRGSEHISQQAAKQLVSIPDGTTLFNLDEGAITESLSASPWVSGVDIEREYPNKLIITPVEHQVEAIAYIPTEDVAWAIGSDGTWIAPVSLSVFVDGEGKLVDAASDGSAPEGATELTGLDAALQIAKRDGALLLTDTPSDVAPKAGDSVASKEVSAGLQYAKGFSADFLKQVKDLSISSVEAISANLESGIEVLLGSPENITEKERVVMRLLSERGGITYINVREPGAYTFRSAPVQ